MSTSPESVPPRGASGAPARVAIGVTGASGAIYAVRTIAALLELGVHLEIVFSDYGRRLLMDELGTEAKVDRLGELLVRRYGAGVANGSFELQGNRDLGARLASGSHHADAMVIVPCSMKTLAAVAHGLSRSLVERAADVTLKEKRRLILVPRETPMSLPALKNLVACAEAGAVILPAMPAFYQHPKSIDDLADFIAGKILNALGFEQRLFPRVDGRVSVSISKEPRRIAGMFDAIARRYDTLNHLLSAGLDRRWRARAIRELDLAPGERVLDMCTGTGDLALAAVTPPAGRAGFVLGVDFSGEMLRYAAAKIRAGSFGSRVGLVRGDATAAPLADESCGAAMVAFGIRNVIDPGRACEEFHRVLRAHGRLAILEFGSPNVPGLRAAYLWYFRHVLPRIGRAISRHTDAYDYLPASVAEFPSGQAFAAVLRRAGFAEVRILPLALGAVQLYIATKA